MTHRHGRKINANHGAPIFKWGYWKGGIVGLPAHSYKATHVFLLNRGNMTLSQKIPPIPLCHDKRPDSMAARALARLLIFKFTTNRRARLGSSDNASSPFLSKSFNFALAA